jgi:hypothetical protein
MNRTGVGVERRNFPRLLLCRPVRIEVCLASAEFQINRFDTDGVTVNVSRGGVLVDVNRRIAVGTSCTVHVLNADGALAPNIVQGTVRHTCSGEVGWQIGLEFERPLEVLQESV